MLTHIVVRTLLIWYHPRSWRDLRTFRYIIRELYFTEICSHMCPIKWLLPLATSFSYPLSGSLLWHVFRTWHSLKIWKFYSLNSSLLKLCSFGNSISPIFVCAVYESEFCCWKLLDVARFEGLSRTRQLLLSYPKSSILYGRHSLICTIERKPIIFQIVLLSFSCKLCAPVSWKLSQTD